MTEGYASDWTAEQLRDAAQGIVERIDELVQEGVTGVDKLFGRN